MFRTLLDTAVLPVAHRFEAFAEFTSYAHGRVIVETSDRANFAATVEVNDFGAIKISKMCNSPVVARRTAAMPPSHGSDLVLVSLVTQGSLNIERDDRQVTVPSGSVVVFDWSRPIEVGNPFDAAEMILEIPVGMLGLPADRSESLMVEPLTATNGIGGLLAYIMEDLVKHGSTYDSATLSQLTSTVIDLLGTAARNASGARHTSGQDRIRRAQIYSYIEQCLAEPELTPAAVAHAQHMSIRQLFRMLREDGTSPASWIRHRRLERCRRELVDPATSHLPVAAIGQRWGFPDAATFNRAFRREFGMPPGEYRLRFGPEPGQPEP